ncbi:MAG: Hpt domain-containing protein [Campylobacterales bacterium]|nr:Hpt domain-containing protein [Campylobacterales bacterium]
MSIFVLAIVWVIYVEYKNAQKYKKERDEKRQLRNAPPSEIKVKVSLKEKERPKPEPKPIEEKAVISPEKVETKPVPEIIPVEVEVEEKAEPAAAKELPPCNYPPFDHSRMIETLGLSEEDAKEFVGELISQIETQLPLMKEAMRKADFHQLEKLTHSIKGSATNLGTGGVSDLLVDFNTYLKEGTEREIAEHYISALETYMEKLKTQYA